MLIRRLARRLISLCHKRFNAGYNDISNGPYQGADWTSLPPKSCCRNEINSFSFLVLRDSLVPLTRNFCDVIRPATPEQFREAYSVARMLHIKGGGDQFD